MDNNSNNWSNNGPQYPNNGQYPNQVPTQPDTMQQWICSVKTCISKYADFNGRAGRPEFWWWTLTCFLLGLILAVIPYLGWIANVALLVPTLAVTWRRLHDIGKAGGFYFIGLIPLVGWIILLVWLIKESEPQPNRFGPGPDNIYIVRPPFNK